MSEADTDDPAHSNRGPTPPSERIVGLDALRGFALLGILVINVWVFAKPQVVLTNPTTYGDFTGANYWAWFAGHVLVQGKFITLFTLLFGAGIVLFTKSAERKDRSAQALHLRRTGWLIVFGLAHAYLLWFGDILVAYGVCALLVVLFRHQPARLLAGVGLSLVLVPSLIEVLAAVSLGPEAIAASWNPSEAALQSEIETYRSGWVDQLDHRVSTAIERQTAGFFSYTAWRTSGTMLFGMALLKWGILSEERSTHFYRQLAAVGGAVGLVTILAGVWYIEASDWAAGSALFWRQFNYWGAYPLALSYVGALMLVARHWPTGAATRALAAVGRTAFSNYILQTVLATSIFYGHGLGLFGRLEYAELLGVVVAIWVVQVVLSVVWLRYFRFGPLEWLWRVLTYRSWQPIRVE